MMKTQLQRSKMAMVAAVGCSLAVTSCAVDLRDAVLTGALDYVSGTTTQLLSQLIILGDDEVEHEP